MAYTVKKIANKRWDVYKDSKPLIPGFPLMGLANTTAGVLTNEVDAAAKPPVELPSLSISDAIGAEEGTAHVFTVTRSGDLSQASSVDYKTIGGSADTSIDLTDAQGTVNFASGESTQVITVYSLADALTEGPETFVVQLTNPSNATIAKESGLAVIIDVPPPPPPPPVETDELDRYIGIDATEQQIRAYSPAAAKFLDEWLAREDAQWKSALAQSGGVNLWAYLNYYDRAELYRKFWKIFAENPVYAQRGDQLELSYRDEYLGEEANSAGWWSMGGGLMLHYLATKDETSQRIMGQLATNMAWYNIAGGAQPAPEGDTWGQYGPYDCRTISRAINNCLYAHVIDAPSRTTGGGVPAIPDWAVAARNRFAASLKWQNEDGLFRFSPDSNGNIPPAQPFMHGLMSRTYADYYDWLEKDPRIIPSLEKMYHALRKLWDIESKSWYYLEYAYTDPNGENWGGGPVAGGGAPDLNCLMLPGLGFLYRETGDPMWKEWGDEALAGAMGLNNGGRMAWLDGFKQFNQTMVGIEYFKYVL
jgi:hypothetical protein